MLNKKDAGFTLIEIMITVFIFSLLVAAIFTVLITGRTSWQIGETRIELQQDLRKGLDWVAEELRQGGTSTITGVPADGQPYNTITFKKPRAESDGGPVDSNGNIVWGEQITYSLGGLDGEQLLRNEVGKEERVLANNIISFQLSRQLATADIVEIALQAEKTTPRGRTVGVNLNFQVKVRN